MGEEFVNEENAYVGLKDDANGESGGMNDGALLGTISAELLW